MEKKLFKLFGQVAAFDTRMNRSSNIAVAIDAEEDLSITIKCVGGVSPFFKDTIIAILVLTDFIPSIQCLERKSPFKLDKHRGQSGCVDYSLKHIVGYNEHDTIHQIHTNKLLHVSMDDKLNELPVTMYLLDFAEILVDAGIMKRSKNKYMLNPDSEWMKIKVRYLNSNEDFEEGITDSTLQYRILELEEPSVEDGWIFPTII